MLVNEWVSKQVGLEPSATKFLNHVSKDSAYWASNADWDDEDEEKDDDDEEEDEEDDCRCSS